MNSNRKIPTSKKEYPKVPTGDSNELENLHYLFKKQEFQLSNSNPKRKEQINEMAKSSINSITNLRNLQIKKNIEQI